MEMSEVVVQQIDYLYYYVIKTSHPLSLSRCAYSTSMSASRQARCVHVFSHIKRDYGLMCFFCFFLNYYMCKTFLPHRDII